jgi:hypothetical protein
MKKYFFSRYLIPIIVLSFFYSCIVYRPPIIGPEKREELRKQIKYKLGTNSSLEKGGHWGVGKGSAYD